MLVYIRLFQKLINWNMLIVNCLHVIIVSLIINVLPHWRNLDRWSLQWLSCLVVFLYRTIDVMAWSKNILKFLTALFVHWTLPLRFINTKFFYWFWRNLLLFFNSLFNLFLWRTKGTRNVFLIIWLRISIIINIIIFIILTFILYNGIRI